jgi:adenine-specific DNA-methyltransferase
VLVRGHRLLWRQLVFSQACFPGGEDTLEKLTTAPKAEVDEAAGSTLHATESRPFSRPELGRIAGKMINHDGDETMRVFAVG